FQFQEAQSGQQQQQVEELTKQIRQLIDSKEINQLTQLVRRVLKDNDQNEEIMWGWYSPIKNNRSIMAPMYKPRCISPLAYALEVNSFDVLRQLVAAGLNPHHVERVDRRLDEAEDYALHRDCRFPLLAFWFDIGARMVFGRKIVLDRMEYELAELVRIGNNVNCLLQHQVDWKSHFKLRLQMLEPLLRNGLHLHDTCVGCPKIRPEQREFSLCLIRLLVDIMTACDVIGYEDAFLNLFLTFCGTPAQVKHLTDMNITMDDFLNDFSHVASFLHGRKFHNDAEKALFVRQRRVFYDRVSKVGQLFVQPLPLYLLARNSVRRCIGGVHFQKRVATLTNLPPMLRESIVYLSHGELCQILD
uniref:ANK_REP_REGION domain-containing protein n=1 Tax=Macrostomum lignano TaxID=282301 RepID=A0A1I8IXR3_9PLAT